MARKIGRSKSGQIAENRVKQTRKQQLRVEEKLELHILGEAQLRRRRVYTTHRHADVLSRRFLHHYAPLFERCVGDFSRIKNF